MYWHILYNWKVLNISLYSFFDLFTTCLSYLLRCAKTIPTAVKPYINPYRRCVFRQCFYSDPNGYIGHRSPLIAGHSMFRAGPMERKKKWIKSREGRQVCQSVFIAVNWTVFRASIRYNIALKRYFLPTVR